MNKQFFAMAFAFLVSAFSVPAFADSFTGVCVLNGRATLTPPITAVPGSGGFTFDTTLVGGTKVCAGSLNGGTITTYPAEAFATGSGTLSCSGSLATGGTGYLTINGIRIDFKNLAIVGSGPQVTFALDGNVSGNAAGQASFATDTGAAGKCVAGASILDFVLEANAAATTD